MINSIIIQPVIKLDTYPCLKSYNKIIVLFTNNNTGTCVHSDDPDVCVGAYSNDWRESEFISFNGKIILKNE